MFFFQFHIEFEGQCGWIIIGGGGGQRVCCPPPSQIIGGGLPPPSSYAYGVWLVVLDCISVSTGPSPTEERKNRVMIGER